MQAALKDPDRKKYRPGQMDFASASEDGSSDEDADSEEEVWGRLACGSQHDPHLLLEYNSPEMVCAARRDNWCWQGSSCGWLST